MCHCASIFLPPLMFSTSAGWASTSTCYFFRETQKLNIALSLSYRAFVTCFQLQVNTWSRHPGCHGNQNCFNQWGVLPDVRQKLVKTVNIQRFNDQRGNVDSFPACHVVTQSHVVGAAVVALHLQQRHRREEFKMCSICIQGRLSVSCFTLYIVALHVYVGRQTQLTVGMLWSIFFGWVYFICGFKRQKESESEYF